MAAMLLTYLIYLELAIAVVCLLVQRRAFKHVRGTRQRYVWLTWRRILAYIVIALALFVALGGAVTGNFIVTVGQTFVGCVWTWTERKRHGDDDDWFNGRWGRIRGWVRQRNGAARKRPATVSAR